MKHSENRHNYRHILPGILLWLIPLALIVPNIALDITEMRYSDLSRCINLLIPAGAYLGICASLRRVGLSGLFAIPMMVLCAFQIVLLFLYGESIIAVDMFLNVLTTNSREAGELLANLVPAIVCVLAVYLPVIILSIISLVGNQCTDTRQRRPAFIASAVLLCLGLGCMAAAMTRQNYRPVRELFPVNVIANIFTAVERTEETAAYFQASENFSYGSQSVRNNDAEIYVLVIGETSRADHWQLNGYGRPTNPRLSSRSGIVYYPRTLSESNTTHKSVPLLMTCFASDDFADSIYSSRSVIDAFREAGFRTAWFSNQRRNHSLIDFFGERADSVNFLVDDGFDHYDAELAECLSGFIEHSAEKKLFVVLHTYGSHFNYKERYPGEFEYFGPDNSTNASRENRAELVNAYDNSLRYVDYTLDRIISNLDSCGRKAALLYLADHGEDIYDDSRDRFLHASPTPTYYQLHVPMLLWMSDSYVKEYPEIESAAKANSSKNVSSSRSAFHTLLSLAGIRCSRFEAAAALSDTAYREPQRFYLNDYNEAVPLDACGLRDQDFQRLAAEGIR